MEVLGNTLEEIAFEKAGIMKPAVPAVHAPQPPGPTGVFRARAEALGAQLWAARPWADYAAPLALQGDYQALNASVATALAQLFLLRRQGTPLAPPPSPGTLFPLLPLAPQLAEGLAATFWPGRSQTLERVKGLPLTLHLDGGHTEASLLASARWWLSVSGGPGQRCLVFNCKQSKPAQTLLSALLDAHAQLAYHRVLFVASKLRQPRDPSNAITNVLDEDLGPQRVLQRYWEEGAAQRGLAIPPSEVSPSPLPSLLFALSHPLALPHY